MYSIKQAELILGSLPAASVTLYYMDIRAYGKGFEEFYQQAKAMGVNFVRGKVAKIEQKEGGDLEVYHEDTQGKGTLEKTAHDMVVLSVGLLPRPEIAKAFTQQELKLDSAGWIQLSDEDESAVRTSVDGVFAAGCATGPKDIPDSVLEASAAASECAAYLLRAMGEGRRP